MCKGEEEHVPNQVLLPEVHPLLSQGEAANRGAIWWLVFPAAASVQTLFKKEHLSVALQKTASTKGSEHCFLQNGTFTSYS